MYIDDFDGSEHPICNYWFIRITSCFIFNFMNLEFYKVVWGQQFFWNLFMVSRNDRPSAQKICQHKMCSVVYIKKYNQHNSFETKNKIFLVFGCESSRKILTMIHIFWARVLSFLDTLYKSYFKSSVFNKKDKI